MHYVGSLPDGTLFASTRDGGGEPRTINLGSGEDALSTANANLGTALLLFNQALMLDALLFCAIASICGTVSGSTLRHFLELDFEGFRFLTSVP